MLARAAAAGLILAAVMIPSLPRKSAEPRASCRPEGRGTPPRHWLGCQGDPGPPREPQDDERLVLGLPLDPNTAGERELAFVPGLSRHLARAVVTHRERKGPFRTVEELLEVKGIGPRRLEQARPHLSVGAH